VQLTGADDCGVDFALGEHLDSRDGVPGVQENPPKRCRVEQAHVEPDQVGGVGRRLDLGPVLGRADEQPAAELDYDPELDSPSPGDALHRAQLGEAGLGHAEPAVDVPAEDGRRAARGVTRCPSIRLA
jgi:hypothetical protein